MFRLIFCIFLGFNLIFANPNEEFDEETGRVILKHPFGKRIEGLCLFMFVFFFFWFILKIDNSMQ